MLYHSAHAGGLASLMLLMRPCDGHADLGKSTALSANGYLQMCLHNFQPSCLPGMLQCSTSTDEPFCL